jgi:2-oxoglutarate ferredoxin oxidoreductase subunit alpha
MNKILMKGNIALCEGAIIAGCQAYFGYPITPQSEIPAHMSKKMVELGRVFIQAESETAAASMLLGAAACGARAMTSSSSPGISLKQECISFLAACELPSVIVNVQRGGPGLGNIASAQGDYFQSVKGGGHGGYKLVVLAPHSAQEMYDLTILAFDLADKYRTPVLILSDGTIGQMMEPVTIHDKININSYDKNWALRGCGASKSKNIHSLSLDAANLEQLNLRLNDKFETIHKNEARFEELNLQDAQVVFVAYGISARIAKSALRMARAQGLKAGLIRPITLSPFPDKIISQTAKNGVKFLAIELSLGQMVEDVRLAVNGKCEVDFIGRAGGMLVTPEDIIKKVKDMLSKK